MNRKFNGEQLIPVDTLGSTITLTGELFGGLDGEDVEVIMSITAPRGKLLLFKGGEEARKLQAIKSFMEEHRNG